MIKTAQKSISFYTLGCRLNQSETASIEQSFEHGGYNVVDFNKPADIVVINTCTVTEGGDADTRKLVNKVSRLNPNAKIALIGCQAQVQKEKLAAWPNVRWIVGNSRKMELADIISECAALPTDQEAVKIITPTIERDSFTVPFAGVDRRHIRANLKIQDGCDFFCSFCEIPYARGRARSRVFKDILKEARILAQAGHRELVLTGINLGTYKNDGKTIMDVIAALEQIDALKRIRISSIEPTTIPTAIFKKMATKSKLCRYLHIPLQSGHDDILKAMKRKYTFAQFLEFIQKARLGVPEICIGTDCIVGFPGETDNHFETTYARLKEAPVDYFHVFSYSKRFLAKSKNMRRIVPAQTIAKRSERLRALSARKRQIYYASLLGTTQEVLFENFKNGFWQGVTDHYVKVKTISTKNLTNTILKIRLNKISTSGVEGEIRDD